MLVVLRRAEEWMISGTFEQSGCASRRNVARIRISDPADGSVRTDKDKNMALNILWKCDLRMRQLRLSSHPAAFTVARSFYLDSPFAHSRQ